MTQPGLVIIADDYGLGDDHDRVMRDLLARGAIDGVSVLVECCSPASAKALRAVARDGQRIGLHFNLTLAPEGTPARPSRLNLLAAAALGRGRKEAGAALDYQWKKFVSLFGRAPDHIDGHEHCHAYPGIDRAVIALAKHKGVMVRSMVPIGWPGTPKAAFIALLGARIRRRARQAGVGTNTLFAGVLPLDGTAPAISNLDEQLTSARKRACNDKIEIWVMVHPGSSEDPVQVAEHAPEMRDAEAAYLQRLSSVAEPPASLQRTRNPSHATEC